MGEKTNYREKLVRLRSLPMSQVYFLLREKMIISLESANCQGFEIIKIIRREDAVVLFKSACL
jgi:hypothetical protein